MTDTAEKKNEITDRDLRRALEEEMLRLFKENREEVIKRAHQRLREVAKKNGKK